MLSFSWRRAFTGARALLVLSCLAVQFSLNEFNPPRLATLWFAAIIVGFFVYSLVAHFWKSLESAGHTTLSLALDFAFFAICTTQAKRPLVWIACTFFVYLLISGLAYHRDRNVALVMAAAVLLLATVRPKDPAFLPAVVFTSLLALAWLVEKRTMRELHSSLARKGVLFRRDAEQSRESERQRIAANFHDGPLQSFVAFQMRLEVVKKLLSRDHNAGLNELAQLQEFCQTQVSDLRLFVRGIRLQAPEELDLRSEVRQVVEQFQTDTKITTTLSIRDIPDNTGPEKSHELIQIIREALNNIQKHAKASHVSIDIEKVGGSLQVTIQDNGAGLPFGGSYTLDELEQLRIGPSSIKRRVRSLGAQMTLDSRPGQGTQLTIKAPA